MCPQQTISINDNKATVTGTRCMACGHCMSTCPSESIKVPEIEEGTKKFHSFDFDNKWLPYGQFDIAKLVSLMYSRRSTRNYKDSHIDRKILKDLIKIGATAPSGTNSQLWTFYVLPTRDAVVNFGNEVLKFYEKINNMSSKFIVRKGLKMMGNGELDNYYDEYFDLVNDGINDWKQGGKDRLFHGATALILVGSKNAASCPSDDALLATQNILLAAHAMGLGSCLIGFVIKAFEKDKRVRQYLKIPKDENIYSAIALGYPDEKYHRPTGRKQIPVTFLMG